VSYPYPLVELHRPGCRLCVQLAAQGFDAASVLPQCRRALPHKTV
jgi:hypothetical protein